jgi:hypothetical protein
VDQAEDEQNAEDEQSKAGAAEDVIPRGACKKKTAQADSPITAPHTQ